MERNRRKSRPIFSKTMRDGGNLGMENIGGRIRKERQKRKLTLEQLSQKTGLSKSFISQIERNMAQPSVTSLKKFANEFGVSVVTFFTDENNNRQLWQYQRHYDDIATRPIFYNRDVRVVRANWRKSVTLPGCDVRYEVLTPDLNRQLEVLYMKISKGDTSGDDSMSDAPGEKFGIVLKGCIEYRVSDGVYRLEAGDSICHPADLNHSWCGLEGDDGIEVIWVHTPPAF